MNTSELSRHERQTGKIRRSTGGGRVRVVRDIKPVAPLSDEEFQARLDAYQPPDDSEIDYSDIPQLTDERLRNAVVICNPWTDPPTKTTLERVQIDSDIIFWILRQVGEEGYQDKMNAMLRKAMEDERAARKA